jgi:hypothetical protein
MNSATESLNSDTNKLKEQRQISSGRAKTNLECYTLLYPELNSVSFPQVKSDSIQKHNDGIYSFPFLTNECSDMLNKEIHSIMNSKLPILSPTITSQKHVDHNLGCILNDIPQLQRMISQFVTRLKSICMQLYDPYFNNLQIDDKDFLAFAVTYTSECSFMDTHADESHITVSICLNNGYEGGALCIEDTIVPHQPLHAICFFGKTPHSTMPLLKGSRTSLVFYLKQQTQEKFYSEYKNYLSLLEVDNNNVLSFHVPTLKAINTRRKESPIENSYTPFLVDMELMIFQFLDFDNISNAEYVCKQWYTVIRSRVWKIIYERLTGCRAEKSYNYKQLVKYLSKRQGIVPDGERRSHVFLHLDDSGIGGTYWNQQYYACNISQSGECIIPTEDFQLSAFFQESITGIYKPRAVFVNKGSQPPMNTLDADQLNYYCTDSSFFKSGYNADADKILESIRHQVESCDRLDTFILTCSTKSGFSCGLSTQLLKELMDEYQNNNIMTIPLISNSRDEKVSINTMKLWNELTKNNKVMVYQYEQSVIEDVVRQYYPNGSVNDLLCRSFRGVTDSLMDTNFKFSSSVYFESIPVPSLNMMQCALSHSITNDSFVTVANESITNKLNQTFSESQYLGASMICRGRWSSKIIMSVVGGLKCNRKIRFVDWCPSGFRVIINYTSERLYETSYPISAHCISNSFDPILFFEQLQRDCQFNESQLKTLGYNNEECLAISNEYNILETNVDDYREVINES